MILENLKSIEDLKSLDKHQLNQLAAECRQLASAYSEDSAELSATTELAIAIHYVFELTDMFILDAPYTPQHTVMTGRISSLLKSSIGILPEKAKEYVDKTQNLFTVGHSTSALNVAVGMAKAQENCKQSNNVLVWLDASSLKGSHIFDELSIVSRAKSNLKVFLIDTGNADTANLAFIQYINDLRNNQSHMDHNLFRNLGIDYRYVENNLDVNSLIELLSEVKKSTSPTVVYLKFSGLTIQNLNPSSRFQPTPYSDLTYHILEEIRQSDPNLVVLSSGTPQVMGFDTERIEHFGSQFLDVGHSEQAAVGIATGLAVAGAHPVWGVYSTFLQKVYDQLLQDVAINNSSVTILVYGGGVDGMKNIAHEGFFDISMSVNIPNVTILAPTCQEAYEGMLKWAIKQDAGPVVIRVPNDEVHHATYPVDLTTARFGNYQVTSEGSEVAIFGVGTYYGLAVEVADLLTRDDVYATIVNPRNLNLYDVETLEALRKDHRLVVTLEDGVMAGGFGEKIARYYGPSRMKVMVRGLHKKFEDNYNPEELRERNGLLARQIANDILDIIL